MRSIFYAVGAGLIGAVLLHIVVILAAPSFSGIDAFSRVLDEGDLNEFHPLGEKTDQSGLENNIPFVKEAVCAFDVDYGPAAIFAEGRVPFWSAAVYDEDSNEVFSMNDRTAVDGALDLVAGTPGQLAAIRRSADPSTSKAFLIELPASRGYVVLRALYPETSIEKDADAFIASASCAPLGTG
ncbi:DUF1254 domain-containing protein [Rhizobium sp. L1K21]|uniref:DUF1254 domain-containing protein n=1 Tax=Rhizobium sp. L1K21 TaxID=2954933 RepID=UPI002093EE55|nr:DUF1254 domain-containing protein [Rhizobium sp. L1K21]MCO6186711.1 DUF1254 domain-containing protein [Rhizobium sp. L1K21]